MNSFNGYSEIEIEEKIINPHGGLVNFFLVICPGYKSPKYKNQESVSFDLIVEDDSLNEAVVQYLEAKGVKEIDWDKQ